MDKAVARFGSEAKLGLVTGYTQHGINRARRSGRVTPLLAYRIHIATEGEIDCILLCPDLDVATRLKAERRRPARNGGRR